MSCETCGHLRERQAFRSPAQLERGLAVVRANVTAGTLAESAQRPAGVVRSGQPPFAELDSGRWPDAFAYYFACRACGALYEFTAETYHGAGGEWRPVETAT